MTAPITLAATDTSALPDTARGKRLDFLLQGAIFSFSVTAIWLIAQPAPLQGHGFIVGLLSQPFWFIATWRNRQWGMFALTIFYTGAWVQGIVNHFPL